MQNTREKYVVNVNLLPKHRNDIFIDVSRIPTSLWTIVPVYTGGRPNIKMLFY